MGRYDIQQVCTNGHQITSRYDGSPQFRSDFCVECGAKTIHLCPSCDHPIKGEYEVDGVISLGSTAVPSHCEKCGEPFPWTTCGKEQTEDLLNQSLGEALSLAKLVCERFHLAAQQLRSRYSDRPPLQIEDEYDVQYLLHAILQVHFDDIRKEEWTPSYAGGSSRVDFLLKEQGIVIEVKKTRESLKAKQIGDELLIDMQRYQIHPDCKSLVCFVYDPDEWICNPRGLENDLNRDEDGFSIIVIIVPKGY